MRSDSLQVSDLTAPESLEDSLAIGLSCPDCETLRFYKFDHTINLIVNRTISGLSVSARCELCSRRFIAVFQWIDGRDGWSYRKPPVVGLIDGVYDENGLHKPR